MVAKCLGIEITELRLGIPGYNKSKRSVSESKKKRMFSETITSSSEEEKNVVSSATLADKVEDDFSLPMKSQVVGWPPVCSYRKRKKNEKATKTLGYMKVSMDGVPYLRKIDLGSSHDYNHLATVLEDLFACLGLGLVSKNGQKSEYVLIYEDNDRDWMLVGDVPWKMFKEACKRLRIVKRSYETGLGLQRDSSFEW